MDTAHFLSLNYPFNYGISPFVAAAHAQTWNWLTRFHLTHLSNVYSSGKYHDMKAAWFTARVFPFAELEEQCLASDLNSFFFIMDDLADQVPVGEKMAFWISLTINFFDLLYHGQCIAPGKAEVLVPALTDLCSRIKLKADPAWLPWFTEAMENFLWASRWEANLKDIGQKPGLADYLQMRPCFSGCDLYVCLITLMERIALPPSVYQHATVQQLIKLASELVWLANDLVSLGKELEEGPANNSTNIVLLLKEERQLTLKAAIEETLKMHDDTVQTFLRLENELPSLDPETGERLQYYVQTLRAFVSGNADWSVLDTKRYRQTALVLSDIEERKPY